MIIQTIRQAIMDERRVTPGFVYVARDGDVIFYVGISANPIFRLCQHLGIANAWNTLTIPKEKLIQGMEKRELDTIASARFSASQLGACILDNAPESLEWIFNIYEHEDAIAVIKRTHLPQVFPRLLEMMSVQWYDHRTIVENALIEELKPYLNVTDSSHTRELPERYRRKIYTHARPEDSSSMYLDL